MVLQCLSADTKLAFAEISAPVMWRSFFGCWAREDAVIRISSYQMPPHAVVVQGAQQLPTLWSHIPSTAIAPYTSNTPQLEVGTYSGGQ